MTAERCRDRCNSQCKLIYHLKNADKFSKSANTWHDRWGWTMSGKINLSEYIQGPQHYLKNKTGVQKPMAWILRLLKSGCLEPVTLMWSYGPQNIATTKVVPWHKPSFLRILTLVCKSMSDQLIIITDMHKVWKTFRIVREASLKVCEGGQPPLIFLSPTGRYQTLYLRLTCKTITYTRMKLGQV